MFHLSNVVKADNVSSARVKAKIGDAWYTAKPLQFSCLCLFTRIKHAWWGFTGKYDFIMYKEDEQNASIK